MLSSIGQLLLVVPNYPPYNWPVGVSDVKEEAFGTQHDEINYPEINYADKARVVPFMTSIDDRKSRSNSEFPLGANN